MTEQEIREIVRECLIEEGFGSWAKEKTQQAWQKTKDTGKAIGREVKETKQAAKILYKLAKGGQPSNEEIQFLKSQSADLGKALVLIGLQAVPGSSLAVVGIEKLLKKHGMTLFPQAQQATAQVQAPAATPAIA